MALTMSCSTFRGIRIEAPSPSAVAESSIFSMTHQIVEKGFSFETYPELSSLHLNTGIITYGALLLPRHCIGVHLLRICRLVRSRSIQIFHAVESVGYLLGVAEGVLLLLLRSQNDIAPGTFKVPGRSPVSRVEYPLYPVLFHFPIKELTDCVPAVYNFIEFHGSS